MLNAVRNFSSFCWLAAKIAGYKPNSGHYSPLLILFITKNPLGYPLVSAIYKLVAHSRFVFRISDCDKSNKGQNEVLAFCFL